MRRLASTVLALGLGLTGGLTGVLPVAWAEGAAEPDADTFATAHLARMAAAVDGLDYEGTLVYLADNRLETLHVVHRLVGGRVEERMVSLSGSVRAVTRDQDVVTCVLSGDHPISVKRKTGIPDLLRAPAIDPAVLTGNYFVHPLGATRVAGRDTDVVGLIPRDDFRYGYRFYLDRQTGLPLKSDLMGTDGDAIEQIMFAAVEVGPARSAQASTDPTGMPVPAGAESVGATPAGLNQAALAPTALAPSGPAGESTGGDSPWRFEDLPPGFAVRMHDSWPEGGEGRVEHFLVSDHLASLSVFVEPLGQGGLSGHSRIGAVHAVGGQGAGHQVTVVGQVPAETVAAVLGGLHHTGAGPR